MSDVVEDMNRTGIHAGGAPAKDRYDVVIVGARVAGAATGMLLARRGWDVLVLDRAVLGSDTRSTHALMKGGVHLLQRWGLLDDVLAAGTPLLDRTTFHYGDESMVLPLDSEPDVPALVAPRRTVLDPILAEAAADAGAEVRFTASVSTVVRDLDGRVVGVTGHAADGIPFEVRARLVVGADGARSLVAREVAAPDLVRTRHASAFVHAYFGPPRSAADGFAGYEWCYRPQASAGVIPTNGGVLAWVGVSPDRFDREVRADVETGFWRLLRAIGPEVHDRVADCGRTSRFHLHPGWPGFLRRSAGPGWALVGDASHVTDPVSAHGMTDALRDAALLGDAIDAGLRRPAAMAAELAWYASRRDELSSPMLHTADAIASYGWSMTEIRLLLLDLSRAMQHELRELRRYAVAATGSSDPVRNHLFA